MGAANPVTCSALRLWRTFGGHEAALLGWAMPPLDDQPFGGREAALLGWATRCHWPTGMKHGAGQIGTRDEGKVPYT